MTILLADDSQINLVVTSRLLESVGYRVVTANSGDAAIELARSEQPDLILMDVQMPGTDGIEATRRIRMLGSDNPPVIVALTGYSDPREDSGYRDAGIDEVIVKPLDITALQDLIARHGLGQGDS